MLQLHSCFVGHIIRRLYGIDRLQSFTVPYNKRSLHHVTVRREKNGLERCSPVEPLSHHRTKFKLPRVHLPRFPGLVHTQRQLIPWLKSYPVSLPHQDYWYSALEAFVRSRIVHKLFKPPTPKNTPVSQECHRWQFLPLIPACQQQQSPAKDGPCGPPPTPLTVLSFR